MVENKTEPVLTNPTNSEINQSSVKPPKFKFPIVVFIIIFFLLLVVVAGAYYLGTKKTSPSNQSNQNNNFTLTETPTETKIETPLFSGQIKKIDQDLKLFKPSEDSSSRPTYYSAGIFNKGELNGYTRILAIQTFGPGEPTVFILATKDFQQYIFDDPDHKTTSFPESDWQNPYSILDKTKIISTKTFDTEQPSTIKLDSKFNLISKNFLSEYRQTEQKDNLGNFIVEYILTTDFSSYKKMSSPVSNLVFYFKPFQRNQYFDQMNQTQKDEELIKEKYLTGDTTIVAIDSTGLPLVYSLNLNGSNQKNISFKSSEIKNQNNLKFYSSYSEAIPGGCSLALSTKVTNLTDADFESIGSVFDVPLYRLKDKNHQLYNLAFKNKLEYYDIEPKAWDEMNKNITKPNLEQYIDQNPLLFIKDYWQRWVAVGEYDIQLPGGCGKPVIYLYPSKITEVSVKFNVPVQFTTDIPKYDDSWKVLAQPNGFLKNLKSNQTTCQQIDFTKKGSEYAKQSCLTNNYPYLYWAGNVYSKEYPQITQGWIVKKADLNNFLQDKLFEIGFNSKEKNDFMEYWLPDMESKNAPYYRISFLQTSQLNSLFPMTVEPRPDTIFRIFLDYLPLSEKPIKDIEPQTLNKLIRQGFTLVEWGGLKRY